jgi:hypothetical protein
MAEGAAEADAAVAVAVANAGTAAPNGAAIAAMAGCPCPGPRAGSAIAGGGGGGGAGMAKVNEVDWARREAKGTTVGSAHLAIPATIAVTPEHMSRSHQPTTKATVEKHAIASKLASTRTGEVLPGSYPLDGLVKRLEGLHVQESSVSDKEVQKNAFVGRTAGTSTASTIVRCRTNHRGGQQ